MQVAKGRVRDMGLNFRKVVQISIPGEETRSKVPHRLNFPSKVKHLSSVFTSLEKKPSPVYGHLKIEFLIKFGPTIPESDVEEVLIGMYLT